MKKLFLIICAFILTAGILTAQDKAAPAKPAATTTKCDMKNCCMMKNSKMVCIKDGKEMTMDKEMTMKNGTKCMPDGSCIGKDGKKMMMKNGDCCDMAGNMCSMPEHKKEPAKKETAAPAK
ncbi:MAG: DUF6799 domain-containing protein [Bacteroidia bacterium]